MDTGINTVGLEVVAKELMKHLLSIHPQLVGVQCLAVSEVGINEWLKQQKVKFGETLRVCPMGQTLSDEPTKGKSR